MVNFASFVAKTQNDRTNNVNPRVNQKLEDRSYIQFEFPGANIRNYRLPFFENPSIKEDNKARLVTYSPISRAGSLFSYAGAESRNLKLDFSINMDHVKYFVPIDLGRYATKDQKTNKQQEQQRFFDKLINPILNTANSKTGTIVPQNNASQKDLQFTDVPSITQLPVNIDSFVAQYKILVESELTDIQGQGQVI